MLGRHHVLSPAADAEQGDDEIVNGEGGDFFADCLDDTDCFVTGNAGEVGASAVSALDDVEVGRINGGEENLDEDIMSSERREGVAGHLDHLVGGAVLGNLQAKGSQEGHEQVVKTWLARCYFGPFGE
jgi:hypothetical protein